MSLDSSNAMLVASASSIIGFGFSYYAFKKLISDKYSKGQEHSNSVYYWCGFLAMIAVGQGLTTVLNEVFFAISNDANIRQEAIVRGIFTALFFPVILVFVAFVISIFKKKNIQVDAAESFNESFIDKSNSSLKSLVFVLLLVISGFVIYNFIPLNFLKSTNEKTFTVKDCISCQNGKCEKSIGGLTGFKVTLSQVYAFIKKTDGQERIVVYPYDSNMRCAILPERNFAFDCNSFKNDSGFTTQSSIVFNGSNKFNDSFEQKLLGSNSPGITMTFQCEVN